MFLGNGSFPMKMAHSKCSGATEMSCLRTSKGERETDLEIKGVVYGYDLPNSPTANVRKHYICSKKQIVIVHALCVCVCMCVCVCVCVCVYVHALNVWEHRFIWGRFLSSL